MDKNKKVNTVNINKLDTDWQENTNICEHYSENRQKILYTMVNFYEMWDGHSGRIDSARHSIKQIAVYVCPFYSKIFCTGPEAAWL